MSSGREESYKDIRKIEAEVVFNFADVTANEDATATATTEQTQLSNLAQTHNGILEMGDKLTTLEPNQFILDGSCNLPEQDLQQLQTGWWSQSLSDGEGKIEETLTFTRRSCRTQCVF